MYVRNKNNGNEYKRDEKEIRENLTEYEGLRIKFENVSSKLE